MHETEGVGCLLIIFLLVVWAVVWLAEHYGAAILAALGWA